MAFRLTPALCFFLASSLAASPFGDWWDIYKKNPKVPEELRGMVDYYVSSRLSEFTSILWEDLNRLNIDQIASYGYLNFKQTVACNYFTWLVPIDSMYSTNIASYSLPVPSSEIEKKHAILSFQDSVRYNTITAKFLQYALDQGWQPYLSLLEEPAIGNPPSIVYQGRRVSQDILNSLLEYIPISENIQGDLRTIVEVGAGSGRTAYCFLTLHPGIKYYIVDIPPALYLSQTYLTELFPEKKAFRFRPIEDMAACAPEIASADLIFLTPDQMGCIPTASADLFLAIDCLHEMKPQAIQYFFDEAQRTSRYFYTKNWMSTVVDNAYSYNWYNYPIPESWPVLFDEPCFVPASFFHALYQIQDPLLEGNRSERLY